MAGVSLEHAIARAIKAIEYRVITTNQQPSTFVMMALRVRDGVILNPLYFGAHASAAEQTPGLAVMEGRRTISVGDFMEKADAIRTAVTAATAPHRTIMLVMTTVTVNNAGSLSGSDDDNDGDGGGGGDDVQFGHGYEQEAGPNVGPIRYALPPPPPEPSQIITIHITGDA